MDSDDISGALEKLVDSKSVLSSTDMGYVLNPEEVMIDREEVLDQARRIVNVEDTLARIAKADTSMDVFGSASLAASRLMVVEMLSAKTSGDRQRAATVILDRALGKAVDRSVNVNMQVQSASDKELDLNIKKLIVEMGLLEDIGLLKELGYEKTGKGSPSALVIEPEGTEGVSEVREFCSEQGVSGGFSEEPEEDPVNNGGESGREDDDRGG